MCILKGEKLSVRYEWWHAHDLTSDQVHGRSASTVVCRRSFKVSFKKGFKNAGIRKATFRRKFTSYVPSIKVRGLKCGRLAERSLKVENVALSSTTVSYEINIVMYV